MRDKFLEWLDLKGLSLRTKSEYLMYWDKFFFNDCKPVVSVSEWIKRHNNGVARAWLRNLQEFLKSHGNGLQFEQEIIDFVIPRRTGRKEKKLPKILHLGQIRQLAEAMPSKRFALMLYVQFYGGLRPGELCGIRPHDINWYDWKQNPEQFGKVTVKGKGNKERQVMLPPWLMKELFHWVKYWTSLRASNRNPDKPIFKYGLNAWERVVRRISIKALGFHVNPHLIRHSCGTYLAQKGLSLIEIRDYLGHNSVDTTQIYVHITQKDLKRKIESVF